MTDDNLAAIVREACGAHPSVVDGLREGFMGHRYVPGCRCAQIRAAIEKVREQDRAEIERLRLIWDEWDDECRAECSSDGHEGDCPAVVLVNALKDRRQRAEKAEAEIERLREKCASLEADAVGRRAAQRHAMRQRVMASAENILCPCGHMLRFVQELDAHLDHMIDEVEANEKKG